MNAVDILRELHSRGAMVRPVGEDRLQVRAPRGAIPHGLVVQLKAQKREVLAIITTHACVGCGRFHFPAPALCYWCAGPTVEA